MAYIERAITAVLKDRVRSSKCLLITGARQVGKSTVIRHDFPGFGRASFDDRLTRMQAQEEPKLFFLNHPLPLFIDEVQKESAILEEIKLIVDESDQRGQFILAGRVSILELQGLSLREIYGVRFNRHFIPTDDYLQERERELRPYSDIWQTIHKGSYPELYDIERDWQDYYSSYVSTYLERDVNELISSDGITFTKFLTAVAARSGEILNYANIAGEVGVSNRRSRAGSPYWSEPGSFFFCSHTVRTP